MDQLATEPYTPHEPFDKLQARLFFLLNLYTSEPCCCVANRICNNLEKILRHDLIFLFPEIQRQYAHNLNFWKARCLPPAEKGGQECRLLH